jgi:hypothetical protein
MDFDTISFVPSMKGWELYSWPNGNNFNHSLLPGTNRLKSYDEVVCNRYVVYGTDSLKMLLGRIPENEPIFWIGKGWLNQCWQDYYKGDLRLPDLFTIKAIQKFCSENNLVLEISD